jgi:hypothetical protein
MNGRGKSDSLVVPEKLSNKTRIGLRRGWGEGGWPRGICLKVAHAGRRAGKVRRLLSGGYTKPLCEVAS